jgi:ribosomal-protein-serine acetyltransferase
MITAGLFTLRPYCDADASEMSAGVRESMETVGRWMPWAKPDFSDYDALCWFARCARARAQDEAHEFGIFSEGGRFIGGCGLNQFSRVNKSCNLGYWVRQSEQGKGAATAATLALTRLAFESLGLARVEIVIAEDNQPSIAVARKAGAVHECLARNRLQIHGQATAAHVFSFVPGTDA